MPGSRILDAGSLARMECGSAHSTCPRAESRDCQELIAYNGTWGFDVDSFDLVRSNGAALGYIVTGMAGRLERAGWRKER